ncbi:hypothetical protein MM326_03650 [Alkalihalobacillus sp. LMS6]|uniref:hypothetical protein n=1 Tax=Alkalihalobacillus sp. LMS6 TaxID=2924034 RepID=UPI0020D17C0E|nr:hypothetical protein [Alkalihalobacillus sp. LMS6]UTR07140.1 hypothetical protein MM326_03650 [Alkalihalobacillus sp. LMS6]
MKTIFPSVAFILFLSFLTACTVEEEEIALLEQIPTVSLFIDNEEVPTIHRPVCWNNCFNIDQNLSVYDEDIALLDPIPVTHGQEVEIVVNDQFIDINNPQEPLFWLDVHEGSQSTSGIELEDSSFRIDSFGPEVTYRVYTDYTNAEDERIGVIMTMVLFEVSGN